MKLKFLRNVFGSMIIFMLSPDLSFCVISEDLQQKKQEFNKLRKKRLKKSIVQEHIVSNLKKITSNADYKVVQHIVDLIYKLGNMMDGFSLGNEWNTLYEITDYLLEFISKQKRNTNKMEIENPYKEGSIQENPEDKYNKICNVLRNIIEEEVCYELVEIANKLLYFVDQLSKLELGGGIWDILCEISYWLLLLAETHEQKEIKRMEIENINEYSIESKHFEEEFENDQEEIELSSEVEEDTNQHKIIIYTNLI